MTWRRGARRLTTWCTMYRELVLGTMPLFLLRPIRRRAIPPLPAQPRQESRRERAFLGGGEIGLDMVSLAHSGNHGRDVRVRENEPKGDFWKGRSVGHERLQSIDAIHRWPEVLGQEVAVSPVTGRPGALLRECTC